MGLELCKIYRELELDIDTSGAVTLEVETELPGYDLTEKHSTTINTETTTPGRRPVRVRLPGEMKGAFLVLRITGSATTRLYGARVFARPLSVASRWAWYSVPGIRPTPHLYGRFVLPIRSTPEGFAVGPLPIRPTPEGYGAAALPIRPTPEPFGNVRLPIRPTPEPFSQVNLPVRPTPEPFSGASLPIRPTPEAYSAARLPLRETPEGYASVRLPIAPTPLEPTWADVPVDLVE